MQLMLKSKEEDVVLYAIELASALGKKEWLPAGLASHPSPRVRKKALEILPLTSRELFEQVRADSDSTVRSTAVERILEGQPVMAPGLGLSELVKSEDLRVRLAALAYLSRRAGKEDAATLRVSLTELTEALPENAAEWKEIARGLGEVRHPAAGDLHLRLLRHPDREVRKLAILSAGRAGNRELVPHLTALLADRRFASEARRALTDFGPRILGSMADLLRDPTEDLEVRRAIPLVLAYIPHQGSVDLLLESLFDYDGLLRYRAIRALGKLRVIDPDLRFDNEKVVLRVREECEQTLWYQGTLEALYPEGDGTDLLAQLLRDKISRGRERVFRLLGLLLPPTTACASFLAMVENDRYLKASAAEYLEHALPGKLKNLVLPLIEPGRSVFGRGRELRSLLDACLRSPDPILRDCAADAVSRGRWPDAFPQSPGVSRPPAVEARPHA
jgi:HEAT repeat protein